MSCVDVSYEKSTQNQRKIDLNNKDYENRVSRSIGAVGKDAIVK